MQVYWVLSVSIILPVLHIYLHMNIYPHLKEEALDRTMWRARFGRGLGPAVRQTTK
jgi:hypothetical protein